MYVTGKGEKVIGEEVVVIDPRVHVRGAGDARGHAQDPRPLRCQALRRGDAREFRLAGVA